MTTVLNQAGTLLDRISFYLQKMLPEFHLKNYCDNVSGFTGQHIGTFIF